MQRDLTDIEQQRRILRERGICVVIPTYNNAGTIVDVVRRSKEQCDDVIVVCDGCTDDTMMLLHEVEDITIVSYPHNGGKGVALKKGFQKALKDGFSYAITLDADGQHYPEDIHVFLEANIQHPEAIIVGQRKGIESIERSAGSNFANAFSNFWFCVQTGHHLADTQTGYRLYPLKKLPCLSLLTSRYEAELELMVFSSWQGVEIVSKEVNVFYPKKEERVSHFRPIKDFSRIFVLNTCLCILAIVYAYPLKLFRLLMTVVRTLYSLLLYLIACLCIMLPYTALLNLLCHDKNKKAEKLRNLLFNLTRFIIFHHGIPGVKCTIDRGGETFEKPAVIICNHQSHLDLMLMLSQTPKVIVLTNDWVWNSPFFGKVLQSAEYYPVSMGIDAMLPKLKDLADRGYSIAVYPEGTRSKDCRIGRFHKGAFHIASTLKLDILPFVEYGVGKVLPKGGKYLRRGNIRLQINKRIPYDEYCQYGTSQEIASRFRKYYIKNYALCIIICLVHLACFAQHSPVDIWASTDVKKHVMLTPYIAEGENNPCVIVCPGGSYFWHDTENEGAKVAEWLQQNGISAFVLNYRTAYVPAFIFRTRLIVRGNQYPDPQNDLQRAILFLKDHATFYGIDTTKVGAMGFSAGGHLVMSVAEKYDTPRSRPAFVAPIYPVVSFTADCTHKRSRRGLLGEYRKRKAKYKDSLSLEKHVPADCPPVFLVNCIDDAIVDYRNSELLDSALTARGVKHKYIQYATGGHGFGASEEKGTTECRKWKEEFLLWMKEN